MWALRYRAILQGFVGRTRVRLTSGQQAVRLPSSYLSSRPIVAGASAAPDVAAAPYYGQAGNIAGLVLLSFVAACLASAQAAWSIGLALNGGLVLVAGAASAATVFALAANVIGPRGARLAGALTLSVALGSLVLAALVKDYSYDGQQYHQQAIRLLGEGWNPLRDEPVLGLHALWINGYAKGPWTWSAAWLDATTSIELGKSLHLWLAGAAGLLAYGALAGLPALKPRTAFWIAGLAAANPVLAYQWPTHMNDSLLGSLMLVLASQAVRVATRNDAGFSLSGPWPPTALALALLPTIKSSGLAYALVIVFAAVVVASLAGRVSLVRRLIGLAALVLVPSVLLLAWNPYVSNTLRHGHPLHPLAGAAKVDIITGNSPSGVLQRGQVEQVFGSLFSASHSDLGEVERTPFRYKWPGVIHREELSAFVAKTDMRIGGFGPWFSLGLILSVAAILVALAQRRGAGARLALSLPIVVLAMALVFPEPWWARYVPQLNLLPLALIAAALVLGTGAPTRLLARLALVVLTVNLALVAGLFGLGAGVRELDSRAQLQSLAALSSARPLPVRFHLEPALAHRLDAAGVRWRDAKEQESCDRWIILHQSTVQVCLAQEMQSSYRDTSSVVERLKSVLGRT